MIYTIEPHTSTANFTIELVDYFCKVAKDVAEQYGKKFNYNNFDIQGYLKTKGGVIFVCYRGKERVGLLACRLSRSIFDGEKRILIQDLLFAKPQSRAAYHLLKHFIDFGKKNADHIISMRGEKTNIKGSSLKRLGFKELETLYRFEVK